MHHTNLLFAWVLVPSLLVSYCLAGARTQPPAGEKKHDSGDKAEHVILTQADLKWVEGPPSLPAGAKMAVLEGTPAKAGPFTIRFKMPADYKVPPHWHSGTEHVTVLSGSLFMGMGEKLDAAQARELPAGGYAVMPAKVKHFAFAKGETVIQVHGVGPWDIHYVNPTDDPRQKGK